VGFGRGAALVAGAAIGGFLGELSLEGGISHIPSLLVVKPRRLPHPLEIMKTVVHLGSSATPTI
jgi:hypothetical protein